MISIVFASNYFNHHERCLCDELYSNPEVKFTFIQTEDMAEERKKLGWAIDLSDFPYIISASGNDYGRSKAVELCSTADVLILGSAPYEFVAQRVRDNKLTFYYAERLFRRGLWHLINPRTFISVLRRFIIPGRKSNFYLLAASGYTAIDTSRIYAFGQGRFKWGHFIEVGSQAHLKLNDRNDRLRLLWAGRFLPLKHPEYPIRIADTLKKRGTNFHLDIIGSGVLEPELKKMIQKSHLEDVITIHRPMKPQEVRSYMEQADIYMFTSDFNEGWGAVLGEAMTSGCAVVTSHGIGATPFLVEHKKNGLIYETGKYDSFERNVIKLTEDENLRLLVSKNARQTMLTQWNAKIAAERFYRLCKSILQGGAAIYFEQGPLSKAELLTNNWFKDDTI